MILTKMKEKVHKNMAIKWASSSNFGSAVFFISNYILYVYWGWTYQLLLSEDNFMVKRQAEYYFKPSICALKETRFTFKINGILLL